jgi:hypothetical protein
VQLGYGGRHLAVGVAVQTREGALCLERKKVLKIIVKKREKTSIFLLSLLFLLRLDSEKAAI